MEYNREKSWVSHLLGRWLKSSAGQKPVVPAPRSKPADPPLQEVQRPASETDSGLDVLDRSNVSRTTSTIAAKLSALKSVFEFEDGVGTRLDELKSPQELLILMHETLLFKFVKLREVGLLSTESQDTLEKLNTKLESVLASPSPLPSPEESKNVQALSQENEELKRKLKELHSRYVKSGIISKREVQLEHEIEHLKARTSELHSMMQIARKRVKALLASQEMLQTLRARNSLLSSKVEHQTKLLRSLTSNQPKQRELIDTIDSLNSENAQLRVQLVRRSELMQQVETSAARSTPSDGNLKKLMAENEELRAQLVSLQDRFEALLLKDPEESLTDSAGRLQSENAQLKDLLQSRATISTNTESGKQEGSESERVLDALKEENRQLKEHLRQRRDQMKEVAVAPSHKKLFNALMRVKEDLRQAEKENELRFRTCEQLQAENEELKNELRKASHATKELRRLKSDLEFQKQLVESLKKTELKYENLRKEISLVESNYKAALNDNREISRKLSKLTGEYNLLVGEYENLFGKVLS